MENVEQTIISQFSNSPILVRLIQNMNEAVDPSTNFDDFYNFVWDITSAQGFGLDIWGRILGIGRVITGVPVQQYFGFQDGETDYAPFNVAPFYIRGEDISGDTVTLNDTAYLTLLLVKALANISDCSIPSINTLLTNLFAGRGKCYVVDGGNMAMAYQFEFALMPFEENILLNSPALLHPTGVNVTIITP